MSCKRLNQAIMVFLMGFAVAMLSESWLGLYDSGTLFEAGLMRTVAGLATGSSIGTVATLRAWPGGKLLIPTIVLL